MITDTVDCDKQGAELYAAIGACVRAVTTISTAASSDEVDQIQDSITDCLVVVSAWRSGGVSGYVRCGPGGLMSDELRVLMAYHGDGCTCTDGAYVLSACGGIIEIGTYAINPLVYLGDGRGVITCGMLAAECRRLTNIEHATVTMITTIQDSAGAGAKVEDIVAISGRIFGGYPVVAGMLESLMDGAMSVRMRCGAGLGA